MTDRERDIRFTELDKICLEKDRKKYNLIFQRYPKNIITEDQWYFESPLNDSEAYYYFVGANKSVELYDNIYFKFSPIWKWLDKYWDWPDYEIAYKELASLDRIFCMVLDDNRLSILVCDGWSKEVFQKIKEIFETEDYNYANWKGYYIGELDEPDVGIWYQFSVPEEIKYEDFC
jgi:hypothetical protein